jgi:hypothetical protein
VGGGATGRTARTQCQGIDGADTERLVYRTPIEAESIVYVISISSGRISPSGAVS